MESGFVVADAAPEGGIPLKKAVPRSSRSKVTARRRSACCREAGACRAHEQESQ